ncbi:hypothetical protein OV079_12600 [Nannocystis pusilla]|uniref:Uncharacterized protein n=1 Tax=Nannocystis pusilla TaxID=889268 RepID=A0A9X3IWX5_9BACT|nr:hypothetical protein [Nannocystis pusilla]MCY1006385.1 hypothetical protein [Nannocystis pusilla]
MPALIVTPVLVPLNASAVVIVIATPMTTAPTGRSPRARLSSAAQW